MKTHREIEAMRAAGRHVAEILLELRERVAPGTRTADLDDYAARAIEARGVTSSFKGYDPDGLPSYPAVLCVSVNEEIVHGIPGSREIGDGDLVSLDFGVESGGFHGDSAVTIPVGGVDAECERLLRTCQESLDEAMEVMGPGVRLSDIGHSVQSRVEEDGFSVVRDFAGHGIGRALHEPPWIPNFGRPGRGPRMVPGMVFAVEPMVTAGGPEVTIREDEWTAATADGSMAAHFEHTILITDHGCETLTSIPGVH
ncbi:MAG: type I methionyl aminopeptidase [Myxococcota bacterium]